MRIGDLNKRVTLQSPTLTADGLGGHTTAWAAETTVFGAIWPLSARESLAGGQVAMEITHRIRIRYKGGVLPTWRVKYGTRYFAVVSVINPNEAGKMLDLLCKEDSA